MTIYEIYRKREISVRTYNVCISNELNSIKDLNDFSQRGKYRKHLHPFLYLKNCGKKSNEELIDICNKYSENQDFETLNESNTQISELTRFQREVINSFILINTNSLSVRSRNAIVLHLKKNLKIKNFSENILLPKNFNIKNIRNIGAKCIPEIEIYISIIKKFLIEVSQSVDEKYLISLKNNFLIQRTFSISKIPSEILESESIFLLTDFLLNQNALYDENHTIIVKKAFKIYQDQKELTLDDIADEVNLTRERVRQIKKTCLDDLFSKLLFIQNFNDDLFQKYNVDINSNQIEINSNIVDIINNINKTNLSKEFITYILFAYLCEEFTLIGNIEDVIFPKYSKSRKRNTKNRHIWNSFYLIRKEIVLELDFNLLAKDIRNRIKERIEESYSFSFKSYLSKFLTNNNIEILNLVLPIAENIINEEFELYLDLDEDIIFLRNTYRQVPEYIIETLEHFNKPSKLSEIYNWISNKYPEVSKSKEALRGSCQRSNKIIYFGRSSTYGLKKWENTKGNIKGGTIRVISEEFLLNFKEPQHKKVIEKHVKQFRPKTNANSIYNNLYIDESNTFVFYENYYIGLSSKKYPDNYKKLSKTASSSKHTWEESLEILKDFTDKEKRLPYSSGCPESEKKLYRWFNNQKVKSYDGKLERAKENLIQEFDEKFTQINKNKSSNFNTINKHKKDTNRNKYSLEELIRFIIKHKKVPDSRIIEERNLYQFYYRNKKNLEKNNTLTIEEGELIHLIKKYGSTNRNSKYSINDLISFFKENERIPDPKVEKDLYHYYHRQKRKLSNLNVFSENELKLISLIELYKSTSLRVVHNIQELINFVSINKRLPSSKNINESKLYQFYYRKKQLFNNQELTQEEEIQFIEVAKLLQNIKYENKRN
jgi:hypothetical protein